MSFFNFRNFGRSSKKNKNQQPQNTATPPSIPSASNKAPITQNTGSSRLLLRRKNNVVSPARAPQHGPIAQQRQPKQQTRFPQQNQKQRPQSPGPLFLTRRPAPSRIPQSQQIMFTSEPFVRTALVKGSFKTIVQLPKYVDIGEWIALNVFEFFNNLNLFYGVIAEYVTPEAYPTMNAGPHTDYLWLDANNRQVSLPASQYIDLALTWINNKISDKNLFPTRDGAAFPPYFLRDVQRIMVQMFRIFAHMYHHHFDKIVHLSLEAHWNSFFAHFISFAREFNIIDKKELTPLLPLIEILERQGKISPA